MKRKLATNLSKSMAAAIVLAFGASGSVYAGGAMKGAMGFDQLDKDGDGLISQQEAAQHAMLNSKFNDADKDGDGQVDEAEFSAFETMETGTMQKEKKY